MSLTAEVATASEFYRIDDLTLICRSVYCSLPLDFWREFNIVVKLGAPPEIQKPLGNCGRGLMKVHGRGGSFLLRPGEAATYSLRPH